MIIRKTQFNPQTQQSLTQEQKQWEKDKKRFGKWVEQSNSGMYARWFDQECYEMDKYFKEKQQKQKKHQELVK